MTQPPADPDAAPQRAAEESPEPTPQENRFALGSSTLLLVVSLFSAMLLGSVMLLLPLPYAAVVTGPTTNTLAEHEGTPLIEISDETTYPTDGSLDLTTVRIYGGPRSRVTPWMMVSAWLDGGRAVVPVEALFPPEQTAEQDEEQSRLEMASSQQSATTAALRSLGYTVGEQVRVAGFTEGSPSEEVLQAGDVIVSVGGEKTPDGDTLRAALQKVTAGTAAPLVVRRDGEDVAVKAPTRASSSGGTVLGVLVEPVFSYPFEVTIQIDNVGGSSAGTMFALGIIDKLTPGSLTGGEAIAGTGTIDPDGRVGPIGFIQQKMIGARDSGASVFLAPRDNCSEVVGHIPDGLSVIAVSELDQARSALEQIAEGKGEEGLARCS